MNTISLYCPDISCQHCAMTIKRELAQVDGITVEQVDVPSKTVRLQVASDAALAAAVKVLQEIGYPPATTR